MNNGDTSKLGREDVSVSTEASRVSGVKHVSLPPHPKKGKKKGWVLLVVLLLVGGLVTVIVMRRHADTAKKATAATRGNAGPIPVVAGTVVQKDVPVFLDGLGTVQAFNTVTVRPRVDGQLLKVGFVEGQDVRAGDVLALVDPAPYKALLDQSEAKTGQDQALLAHAQVELKRDADLLASRILAPTDYDTQKALVDQYAAAVKADQAAADSSRVQLGYTTITSPIDGRTGIRLIDAGNMVHAADANGLVVITQLRPVSVVFTLPEATLSQIHQETGSNGLQVLAVERDNQTVLSEGKLAVIDNQIDTTTGTIKLKATFPNDDLHLWPGQFVNARLHVSTHKGGIVIPTAVVQRGPEGAYAFLIQEDSTVKIQPIKVEQSDDKETLVSQGLQPGQQVVVDGQYKLQAGSKVTTSEPDKSGGRGGRGARGGSDKGGRGGSDKGARGAGDGSSRGGRGRSEN